MKKILLLFFFTSVVHSKVLKVLTYDSMVGKKSLGSEIEIEFKKKCVGCLIKFEVTKDLSSLYTKLQSSHDKIDVVLGLDGSEYRWALEKKLIAPGALFEKSPFAIIVDTEKFPQSKWPKNWKEVMRDFQKDLIVQDPRLSQAGLGWLRVLFEMNLGEPSDINKIVSRVYPSWSAAYNRFLEGESRAVWSYLSSEAYHRCNSKKPNMRYKALPLKEGYPVQEEWIALSQSAKNIKWAKIFLEVALSSSVQEKIPLTNWMFPGVPSTPLPSCFNNELGPWKEWIPTSAAISFEQHKRQLDKWTLL